MTGPEMKKAQPDPLSREALRRFDDLFGLHPGFRPPYTQKESFYRGLSLRRPAQKP